jgi:parallel beta-helix repeat protein
METLRKTAAVLIFPVLAGLIACHGEGPTEPDHGTTGIPGGGRTRWVNGGGVVSLGAGTGSSCSNPGYNSIQAAVTAAISGDRIKVCAGTYTEQVVVGSGKDNIQLISVQLWKAVIKSPAVPAPDLGDVTSSIVRVTDAHNVTILAFTITGPGQGPCSLQYGVRVDNSGSANVLGNHIIHVRGEPLVFCERGAAVIVGRQTAASGKILGNVIEDYQKNGPTVTTAGSNADISYNRVLGTPNAEEFQNGIQASGGATATVRHNFVAQNRYTLGGGATGMLFIGPGQVLSEHNTVTSNDYGVYTQVTPAGTSVKESRVKSSALDAVVLDGSNGNQLSHNATEHNGFTGFFLTSDAQNNSIAKNRVSDNDDSGILLNGASNNFVRENHVHSNGTDNGLDQTDGIRINIGSANQLSDNHLKRNVMHDCHDEVYPTNTWTNNRGGSSYPPGSELCGDDDADELEPISAFGWDANYAWYIDYPDAVDFEWSVGYTQLVDLDSILALLPIKISVAVRPRPRPSQ